MLKIDHVNTIEQEVHRFAAEASSLGLHPGEWPQSISTSLGNSQPFLFSHRVEIDGDLLSVQYTQAFGCVTLNIWND